MRNITTQSSNGPGSTPPPRGEPGAAPRVFGWRALVVGWATASTALLAMATPTDIGSRRELFVDDALIQRMDGGAQLRLHSPVPREVVLVRDAPWEGAGSGYTSVFHDGTRDRKSTRLNSSHT